VREKLRIFPYGQYVVEINGSLEEVSVGVYEKYAKM